MFHELLKWITAEASVQRMSLVLGQDPQCIRDAVVYVMNIEINDEINQMLVEPDLIGINPMKAWQDIKDGWYP